MVRRSWSLMGPKMPEVRQLRVTDRRDRSRAAWLITIVPWREWLRDPRRWPRTSRLLITVHVVALMYGCALASIIGSWWPIPVAVLVAQPLIMGLNWLVYSARRPSDRFRIFYVEEGTRAAAATIHRCVRASRRGEYQAGNLVSSDGSGLALASVAPAVREWAESGGHVLRVRPASPELGRLYRRSGLVDAGNGWMRYVPARSVEGPD